MMANLARAKPECRNPRLVAIDRFGLTVLGVLCLATVDARAQPDTGAESSRAFSFSPSVTVSETLSNNVELSSTDKRTDLVTQVSPGIQARSTAGWAQGFLNYSLVGLNYARGTDSDSIEQSLAAAVKTQSLDHHLFLDASANISRQNITAFGKQSPDASLRTDNQTQVVSIEASPYVQGLLGGAVAYRLGGDCSTMHTGSNSIGNSTNQSGNAHLGTAQSNALVGWGLDVSDGNTDFSQGRITTNKSAIGSLVFTPDGELQFSLRGGREGNNVETLNVKYDTTFGGELKWMPSTRTTLDLQDDKRYFGNAYNLSFQHRTAQTVWMLSDSREVVNDGGAGSQGQMMTAFDLVYLQLASKYPDPITRASQALLELQALGLNPLVVIPSGFLTSAVSLQRNVTFSVAYIGLRTSLLLTARQGDISRLDPLSAAADSLSNGSSIREQSISLSGSQRLTPQSSANLGLSEDRTIDRVAGSRVVLRVITVNWVAQLGLRTQFSLGVRHSVSSGDSSYTESALLATLSLQI